MDADDYQYRIKKENRINSRSAKTKPLVWCSGCDANQVGLVGKCEICGSLLSEKKIKNFELKD